MRIEYFQLIDRVTALDLAELTIRVEADVPSTSTIFEGHFPGHPLMPGVLLVEVMAQASGWLVIARSGFKRMALLAAIKEVKLRNLVTPGMMLEATAKAVHEGSGFTVTDAEIRSGGKPICSAQLTLRVVDFPVGETQTSMRELASRIGLPLEAAAHG